MSGTQDPFAGIDTSQLNLRPSQQSSAQDKGPSQQNEDPFAGIDTSQLDLRPKSLTTPTPKRVVPTTPQQATTQPAESGIQNWVNVPEGASASDVLSGAVQNAIPSLGRAGLGFVQTFHHPLVALNTLYSIGQGIGSKLDGLAGVQQDPQQKAQTEAPLNALMENYKDAYSSWDKVLNTLANDPARLLLDLSAVLGAPELALGKSAGIVGDVARAAGTASRTIDPFSVAGSLIKGGRNLVRGTAAGAPATSVADVASATNGKLTPADLALSASPETNQLTQAALNNGNVDEAVMRNLGLHAPKPILTGEAPVAAARPFVEGQMAENHVLLGKMADHISGATPDMNGPHPTALSQALEQPLIDLNNSAHADYAALSKAPGAFLPGMEQTVGKNIADSLQESGFLNQTEHPKVAPGYMPSASDLTTINKTLAKYGTDKAPAYPQTTEAINLINKAYSDPEGALAGVNNTLSGSERIRQRLNELRQDAQGSDKAGVSSVIEGFDKNIQDAIDNGGFSYDGSNPVPAEDQASLSNTLQSGRQKYKQLNSVFYGKNNDDLSRWASSVTSDQTKDAGIITNPASPEKHNDAQGRLASKLMDPVQGPDTYRQIEQALQATGQSTQPLQDFVRQSMLQTNNGLMTTKPAALDKLIYQPGGVASKVLTPEELSQVKKINYARHIMSRNPTLSAKAESLLSGLIGAGMWKTAASFLGHNIGGWLGAVAGYGLEGGVEHLLKRRQIAKAMNVPKSGNLGLVRRALGLTSGVVNPRNAAMLYNASRAISPYVANPYFAAPTQPKGIDRILHTIKAQESSGDDYKGRDPRSSASGAYKFTDGTWNELTNKYGIGQEYSRASDAPPAIQDAVAGRRVQEILQANGGDVSKVPLMWYTGNPEGHISPSALALNGGLTPAEYQRHWMHRFQTAAATGGRIERASGGRTGLDHKAEAERLINAVDRVRKAQSGHTKAFLDLPDEVVTKALAAANEAI